MMYQVLSSGISFEYQSSHTSVIGSRMAARAICKSVALDGRPRYSVLPHPLSYGLVTVIVGRGCIFLPDRHGSKRQRAGGAGKGGPIWILDQEKEIQTFNALTGEPSTTMAPVASNGPNGFSHRREE